VCLGALFVATPLLASRQRGLGGLFIPGLPILITGCILLFASVFGAWGAWEWLWPLEVLAVGAGFLFAAIRMRVIWLLIPAAVIGGIGSLCQFCAVTGWWEVWALAWTVVPLSLGLALLAIGVLKCSTELLTGAAVLCGLAGIGFVVSLVTAALSIFIPVWWLWRWVGPVMLLLVGFALLAWGLIRVPVANRLVLE
jgi:hypothetical protein